MCTTWGRPHLLALMAVCALLAGCVGMSLHHSSSSPQHYESSVGHQQRDWAAGAAAADDSGTAWRKIHRAGPAVAAAAPMSLEAVSFSGGDYHQQQQLASPEVMIVKTANMRAEVLSIDEGLAAVTSVAAEFEAMVDSQNVHRQQQQQYSWDMSTASIALRVRSTSLDALLARLHEAITAESSVESGSPKGRVTSENVEARDETAQYIDAVTREKVETAALEQMEQLLKKANTVHEILEVQREMNSITSRLESARQKAQYISKRAAMSTVRVDLNEMRRQSATREEWSLLATAGRALQALVKSCQGAADFVVWAGLFGLPWCALIGIIIAVSVRLMLPWIRSLPGGGRKGGQC